MTSIYDTNNVPLNARPAYARGATQSPAALTGAAPARATPGEPPRLAAALDATLITRETAFAHYDAGLNVCPPHEDGSKRPALSTWKHFQDKRVPRSTVEDLYRSGRQGIGWLTGAGSGGLEVLEFDDRPTYDAFKSAAANIGLADLVERIEAGYVSDSPGGGVHWPYRCTEIAGNTKLARRPKLPAEMKDEHDRIKVLIETRGTGGFVIEAPSGGGVHPTGRPYVLRRGSVKTIATITPQEREDLHAFARSFDLLPRQEAAPAKEKQAAKGGARPGDDLNERADWEEVLKGWQVHHREGEVTHWTRPGKDTHLGPSATTNYKGSGLLYVFSSSTPFDPERSYSKFAAYTTLEHGGDFASAAKALAAQGYGQPARGPSSVPYEATPHGLVYRRPTQHGEQPVLLTNFTAKIEADVAEDDGLEVQRRFLIGAHLNGRQASIQVPALQFGALNWAVEALGSQAVVYAGMGIKDHARAAIQILSPEPEQRRVFTHTGWRLINKRQVYLHAGGGIGAEGPVAGVEVRLDGALAFYQLPDAPAGPALRAAVESSLRILDVASRDVTLPSYLLHWRALLGGVDLSEHLTGESGGGKSELAALMAQHMGAGMDRLHLPASWSATENYLEGAAFSAKDAVLVVDDFSPRGTKTDIQSLHKKADRVLRAQGNSSGRGRMRADGSLRPVRPPRGSILSTGEDTPAGLSLRARLVVVEVPKKDAPGGIDWKRLTACQKDAAAGLYAQATAGFLRWEAGQYELLQRSLGERVAGWRAKAHASTAHQRTPGNVAELMVGGEYFLDFCVAAGVLTPGEAQTRAEQWWKVLGEVAEAQAEHLRSENPARRFMELVGAAIISGRAHVADGGTGAEPVEHAPVNWGWELFEGGAGENAWADWRAQGDLIGWLQDDGGLFLQPDAAFAAVQRVANDQGTPLPLQPRTLWKRLWEEGLLASRDETRQRYTIRKVLVGERREVLHLRLGSIPPPGPSQPSQPSHETPPQSQDPSGTGRSNGTVTAAEGVRPSHETVPQSFASEFKMDSAGTDGTVGTVVDTYSPPNVQRTAEGMRTHPPTAPTSRAVGTVEERM